MSALHKTAIKMKVEVELSPNVILSLTNEAKEPFALGNRTLLFLLLWDHVNITDYHYIMDVKSYIMSVIMTHARHCS